MKLCYRRRTARRAMLVKILTAAAKLYKHVVSLQKIHNKSHVMELEGRSWPSCSKQPRLVDCRIGVISNSTVDEFCWQHDRLAVEKLSKFTVCDKVTEAVGLPLFWGPEFYCNTVCDWCKEAYMPKPVRFFQCFDTIPACDRQTDGHTHDDTNTAR